MPPITPNQAPPQPQPSAPVAQGDPARQLEIQRLHEESLRRYPQLHLSPGEYVIFAVKRHPIGLLQIWGFVGLSILLVMVLVVLYAVSRAQLAQLMMLSVEQLPSPGLVSVPLLFVLVLFIIGGAISTFVYLDNRFYLTNESVIQVIRTNLLARREQTINLDNIEDASFRQRGLLQMLLNYGSLRLSTEGEETTYIFNFAANPRLYIGKINDAAEAFKRRRQAAGY